MNNAAVKFLGNTDDVTTCECCGRKDLKSTVALSINEGDAVYYGIDCAARALARDAKEIRKESRKADRAKERIETTRRNLEEKAKQAPWFTFLAVYGTGSDVFRRIESLGGYTKAREAFRASIYYRVTP